MVHLLTAVNGTLAPWQRCFEGCPLVSVDLPWPRRPNTPTGTGEDPLADPDRQGFMRETSDILVSPTCIRGVRVRRREFIKLLGESGWHRAGLGRHLHSGCQMTQRRSAGGQGPHRDRVGSASSHTLLQMLSKWHKGEVPAAQRTVRQPPAWEGAREYLRCNVGHGPG